MRRCLLVLGLALVCAGPLSARGLLIPEDKTLPPLAMLNHKVTITIDDQVAVTRVEQTFRNHTDRGLEATYIFPVPKGASVDEFAMWVGDKKVTGELIPADQAREIYTSIVRQTHDPALLEVMDQGLLRMKVFPVPAKGDQKVALSYKYVAPKDGNLVEYLYPLKADGRAIATLEEFSITATVKSQHDVQNVYSPSHTVNLKRASDREVTVSFDKSQGLLDRDFQLFYSLGDKDVGLTALTHRPIKGENGFFMLLVSPKVEMAEKVQIPRDVILVLDTSGSMRGDKMKQARKALTHLLTQLNPQDRFGLINFATTVNKYHDNLTDCNKEQVDQAVKWVEKLDAHGGTAINDALLAALDMRSKEAKDEGRVFTVVFFTDGEPTIGVTEPEKILKNVAAKNTGDTRIFTVGVGYADNINASLLDQLADQSRAVSTYVRPEEDIDTKVTSLYAKISHPVLTNLKLTATNDIGFTEIYPTQLPDLFHGGQLVVFGRYSGKGSSAIRLTGNVGKETKEFVYETTFAEKTNDDKAFVEQLWARRKVGFMLDEIRVNGAKKELVDEVIALAKKYGITTPYTSYLIVPDAPVPTTTAGTGVPPGGGPRGFGGGFGGADPEALRPATPGAAPTKVEDFAKHAGEKPGDVAQNRGQFEDKRIEQGAADGDGKDDKNAKGFREAKEKKMAYDQAMERFRSNAHKDTQEGQLGVQLSLQTNNLRGQTQMDRSAQYTANGRNCMELGGVWIDDGYNCKMKTVVVKAQGDAYFRILEKHPEMRSVYQLGNHLVWVAPSGDALVIDSNDGKEKMEDKEIEALFVAPKK